MDNLMLHGPFFGDDLNMDAPIYRIHAQQYLSGLLAGRLVLPATSKWDDPYENLISWCAYWDIDADGKPKQVFLGEDRLPTFGLCWSTIEESDAIWRIYSRVDKNRGLNSCFSGDEGVRLRSTPRKLLNALATGMGAGYADNCCIGSVKYKTESEVQTYFANIINNYRDKAFSGVHGHVDALLVKRTPFAHEHEIRLLYVDSERRFARQDVIDIPFDVNGVIEEITLDPRLRRDGGEGRRAEWLRASGFENTINTSMLYQRTLVMVHLPRTIAK
jgi:hypothetical protein